MDLHEAISNARESITVKRVYGEPYERNGVMVIPAAEDLNWVSMGGLLAALFVVRSVARRRGSSRQLASPGSRSPCC